MNGKLTRINRKDVPKNLGLCCIIRVGRCGLILECCVIVHTQNTCPDMQQATLQPHFSTAIIRPCWMRRNHFLGQDNIMPCLKPTKGGALSLRPPYTFQLSGVQPLHATKLRRVW